MNPASNPQPVPATDGARGALSAGDVVQYLTFLSGGDTFGIEILGIREIIEYEALTQVPMMPASIRGVINVRGAVVPVLDLAARFGRDPSKVARKTCIVIVELDVDGQRHDMGVIVDAVNAVLEIPKTSIEPPPSFGAKIRTDFISGMAKVENRFVILLDVAQVLSVDEIAALAGMHESGHPAAPATLAAQAH